MKVTFSRFCTLVFVVAAILFLISLFLINAYGALQTEYKIAKFWDPNAGTLDEFDERLGYCFHSNYYGCGVQAVQIGLDYLNVKPLPTQRQLADELGAKDTWVHHDNLHKPFKSCGFKVIQQGGIGNNFNTALKRLKGYIAQDFLVIVCAYLNDEKKMGSYYVVTGYDENGVWVHGNKPNMYYPNSKFSELWRYQKYWVLVVKP